LRYHVQTADLIQRSARKARELGHSYVGSAHILLALSREPGAAGQVLRQLGVDPDLTERMAQLLYGAGTPDLPLPQGLTRGAQRLLRAQNDLHSGKRRSRRRNQRPTFSGFARDATGIIVHVLHTFPCLYSPLRIRLQYAHFPRLSTHARQITPIKSTQPNRIKPGTRSPRGRDRAPARRPAFL